MVWIPRGELPQMKLNGNDIELLKLCLEGRPQIYSPESKTTEYELDGGFNGNVFVDTGWNNTEIVVRFNYLEETATETFREKFAMFRQRFFNAETLEFNDQPDVIYNVKHVKMGNALNDFVDYGSFDVTFICEPFGTKISEIVTITGNAINSLQNNSGYYTAYPYLEVTGLTAGDKPRIRMFEVATSNYFFDLQFPTSGNGFPTTGSKLIIDGRRRLIYYESSGGVKSYPKNELTMTNFPAVPVGSFRVITALSGTSSTMVIKMQKNEVV